MNASTLALLVIFLPSAAVSGQASRNLLHPNKSATTPVPTELRVWLPPHLNLDLHEIDAAVVAPIKLAPGHRTLLLYYADPAMNGPHGGPAWILEYTTHGYALISEPGGDLGGNQLDVCAASSHGYRDFRIVEEGNAAEHDAITWRFNGETYRMLRRSQCPVDRFSHHC